MLNPIVTNYVDAALAQLRRSNLMIALGNLPDAMRDDSIPPRGDWQAWRAIPSTATDAQLDALEHETGCVYPPIYRDFLRYQHFFGLTEVGVRFRRHLCDTWYETLHDAYFGGLPREHILDVGLLPFGAETQADAGPACFDTKRRAADGDCPVVFWDHEWVGTKNEVQLLFSSAAKMFECLSVVAIADPRWAGAFGTHSGPFAAEKRLVLEEFEKIDPVGAGGPARDYWIRALL
ncbi:MAG: SMI1/KNR4 family protein [Phycisphaerae bacterium]|nr:SMI1/KNR4 family protein [Phycisphaerae bacterium]